MLQQGQVLWSENLFGKGYHCLKRKSAEVFTSLEIKLRCFNLGSSRIFHITRKRFSRPSEVLFC